MHKSDFSKCSLQIDCSPCHMNVVEIDIWGIYCCERIVGLDVNCVFPSLKEIRHRSIILSSRFHAPVSKDVYCKWPMQAQNFIAIVPNDLDLTPSLTFWNTEKLEFIMCWDLYHTSQLGIHHCSHSLFVVGLLHYVIIRDSICVPSTDFSTFYNKTGSKLPFLNYIRSNTAIIFHLPRNWTVV